MTPKKRKRKPTRRVRSRPTSQRSEQRSWLGAHHLAVGLLVLLLVLVVGAILLITGYDGDSSQAAEAELDKSKGAADAPVVVVEYGDFQ